MKLDLITNKNDEFYTPKYAIAPLIKYLPEGKCWCPFDTVQSIISKEVSKVSDVVSTHIQDGFDFFNHEEDCDFIVSNPPYSLKGDVFERLFSLGKPFAMLVGIVGLFESKKRFNMFKENEFEVMYLDKRVSYFKDYNDPKPVLNPPFSSVWLCSKILPKQIVFEEIDKKDV